MPGFNIASFNSLIETNGLQKTNKFKVTVPIPVGMLKMPNYAALSKTAQWMEYFADSAIIPGAILGSHVNLRYGYGPFEKKPTSPVFEDLPLSFIGDGLGGIHNFFMTWMLMINNFDMSDGINPANTRTVSGHQMRPYHLSYKYEYMSDVNVIAYNDAGYETMNIVLREAWPTMVGNLPMNWQDQNQIAKVPVVLTFMDWYPNELNLDP